MDCNKKQDYKSQLAGKYLTPHKTIGYDTKETPRKA